jgi:hypothetical protein
MLPSEMHRLVMQFSSNTAQAGRLLRFLDGHSLVPMIVIALKYKWYNAIDTMAHWASIRVANQARGSERLLPAFCTAFSHLTAPQFTACVSRDSFNLSEEMIFVLVLSWVQNHIAMQIDDKQLIEVNVGDYVEKVVKHVRWTMIPLRTLLTDVYESGLLTDTELVAIVRAQATKSTDELKKLSFTTDERKENELSSWTTLVDKDLDMNQRLAEYLDFLDHLSVGDKVQFRFEGYWQNGIVDDYDKVEDKLLIHKDPTHGDQGDNLWRFSRNIRSRSDTHEPPSIPDKFLPTTGSSD